MYQSWQRRPNATALVVSLWTLASVAPVSAQPAAPTDAKISAPADAKKSAPVDTQTAAPAETKNAALPTDTKPVSKKRPVLSDKKAISSSVTVNLLNLLVKQGVLKDDQAKALIKQAEDEAFIARQAAKDANTKADEASKTATAAASAANPPGTKHVTYVPEIVKRQLREDIKREVMAKAEAENWASPGKYPEWAQRIRLYGDARLRYQGHYFPPGNNQGNALNFNAINTGQPYDFRAERFPPTFDATQDRNLFRLRARLGAEIDLSNGFFGTIGFGTGDTAAPVSTNATFGANGGDFSKYAVYLDRGFLRYQNWNDNLNVYGGRFDNPFYSAVDHMWFRDLRFDGFAVQAKREIYPGMTPFAVAGAFPIFNTDLNAGIDLGTPTGVPGQTEPTKATSRDKFLFGGQVGFISRVRPDMEARAAVAFYDFMNVQGRSSKPCLIEFIADNCSTDIYRPSFAQKGNSYTPLRNIIPTVENKFGTINQFQYFGLVGAYRPVVIDAAVDFDHFNPVHVVLSGQYINNTAFDRGLMDRLSITNRAGTKDRSVGPFNGGNQGLMGRITVGHTEIRHLWDWNVNGGYKYMESDATVDAFTDPEFGLGGTNLKGYFVGANLGISDNVWTTMRWMSANNISGVPYAVDVLQVDVNARF